MLRDFVIALSLANLWFFNVWRLFLINHPTSYPYYHWKTNPAPILLAVVLDVLLLATALWLGITLARRAKRTFLFKLAQRILLLMFLVVATNIFAFILFALPLRSASKVLVNRLHALLPSIEIGSFYSVLWILAALLLMALCTVVIHKLIFERYRMIRLAVRVILVMSPFVLITFGQAASQWTSLRSGTQFREETADAIPQSANQRRRVLWVIFDELDYRLSFADRPPGVELPAFDRLRQESIFGTNAYAPAGDTILSLPALTTGRLVARSTRSAPNELMLTFADNNETLPWSSQPNVFSRARELGRNSALAGWYHPYCRIFGRSLRRCFGAGGLGFLNDQELASSLTESDSTLMNSMIRLAANTALPSVVRLFILGNDPQTLRASRLASFLRINQWAIPIAADPAIDLIMIHYPIPHPPGIFSRSTHNFSLERSSGYLDNLELADRTLGDLRQRLEENHLWESTIVLISSDHSLRADRVWRGHLLWSPRITDEEASVLSSAKDERVPFILKIPGASRGLSYEPEFNTVLSQDLLLELLVAEITTHEGVIQWLNQHRSIGESPYIDTEK